MATGLNRARHVFATIGKCLALVATLLISAVVRECAAADPPMLFKYVASSSARRVPMGARRLEHINLRVTTASADLFRIDMALLRRCSTPIFGQNQRRFTFSNGRIACGTHQVRLGLLSGNGEGTFTIHQGRVTGAVSRGDATFRVEPVQGRLHALIKVDTTGFPAADAEPHEPESRYRSRNSSAPKTEEPSKPIEIDVLVAYTRAAAAANDDFLGLIHQAILDANASYRNSNINLRLNLVDSFQLPYREGVKSFKQIVEDFAGNSAVNTRRDRSGADVSVLIVNAPGFAALPI